MFETTYNYSLLTRSIALSVMVCFSFVVLLGFSLAVDLKPAKALFGIDASIQIAFTKIWDFLKAIAKQFLLKFAANFMLKMFQKLESLHIIKSMLDYSDALKLDVAIGGALNKLVGKPKTQVQADKYKEPENTNAASIALKATPAGALTEDQMAQLAYLSLQTGTGGSGIRGFSFEAEKTKIEKGESTILNWQVDSNDDPSIEVFLDTAPVDLVGGRTVKPEVTKEYRMDVTSSKGLVAKKTVTIEVVGSSCEKCVPGGTPSIFELREANNRTEVSKGTSIALFYQVTEPRATKLEICGETLSGKTGTKPYTVNQTTTYVLNAYSTENVLIGAKSVKITVPGTDAIECKTSTTKQAPGLTLDQRKDLMRGGVSLLTSQVACGGVNNRVVRNVAVFNAAMNRGIDPKKIDPSSGNFYTDMYKLGAPGASSYFQELAMRDVAANIDALADQTVQQELTSNGLKNLRAEKNGISRTSDTIAGFMNAQFSKALDTLNSGSDTGFAAKAIGNILADMVTKAIFQNKGKVITENPFCGIANIVASEAFDGKFTQDQIGSSAITVNKASVIIWKTGDKPVDVEWSFEPDEATKGGTISVTGLPAECNVFAGKLSGKCVVTPTGNMQFDMNLTLDGKTQTLSSAMITYNTETVGTNDGGDGTGGGGQPGTVTAASFQVDKRTINWGQDITLSWQVTGERFIVKINGGSEGSAPSGSKTFGPDQTTTYTMTVHDKSTGAELWGKQEITVTVIGGPPSGQTADLSPGFKVRE